MGLFLRRRSWWPWLLVPAALVAVTLWLTGDIYSALAGFLALGITIAGALAYGWRWWPPYLLLASAVALVLLLTPDSYATFGLIFLTLAAGIAGAFRHRFNQPLPLRAGRPTSPAAARS